MDREVVHCAILEDLHGWGADLFDHFKARVGEETTTELFLSNLIKTCDGHTFTYVALAGKGRKQLGLSPNHTVEASVAARHIMRREARAKLERIGMTYVGVEDRVLRRFVDPNGSVHFLAVSVRGDTDGYTARAVRRLFSRYQKLLFETHGTLVIATPQPGRLSRTIAKHQNFIKTLRVDGRICRTGN